MKYIFSLFVVIFIFSHFITSTKTKSKLRSRALNKNKFDNTFQTIPLELDDLETQENINDGFDSASASESESGLESSTESESELPKPKTKLVRNRPKDVIIDSSNVGVKLQNWLTISSPSFKNQKKFPILSVMDEQYDISISTPNFQRLNFFNFLLLPEKLRPPKVNLFSHNNPEDANLLKNDSKRDYFWFWFRANEQYVYYSSTPLMHNQLGTFNISKISVVRSVPATQCFEIADSNNDLFRICALNKETKKKWLCFLQKKIKMTSSDPICQGKTEVEQTQNQKIKKVIQPLMIIPLPSHNCNDNWNYDHQGKNWECKCKEGLEQSPIDLPDSMQAIKSSLSPIFKYKEAQLQIDELNGDNNFKIGDRLKIGHENGALRIKAPSFGKVVTLDGGVYRANEIVFNTPSNHKINGKSFDMEIQIVHKGISKGDIGKHVVLSFLFVKKAGATNKFLEKLDIFNLPNKKDGYKELTSSVFIPDILLQQGEDGIGSMIPFSFFTYNGSLQEPPCNERTIMYVASKPIEVSHFSIQLIKESLRMPDQMDQFGNVVVSESNDVSNRVLQKQHGRSIFHFNSATCNLVQNKKTKVITKGHYEKAKKTAKKYFYVGGEKPSGLPGSWVVTEKEALNLKDDEE